MLQLLHRSGCPVVNTVQRSIAIYDVGCHLDAKLEANVNELLLRRQHVGD